MMPTEHLYNSDDLLEKAIYELFHNSHVINSEVTVKSYKCDVTLEGTVETEEEKNAATTLSALVQGVESIHNNLIVTGRIN